MKTIVFIGTQKSGSSREAIRVAKDLGYLTVLLTNREKQLKQREEYPDIHFMKLCNIADLEELKTVILELELKAFDIKAIVSFVDSYTHIACLLAESFELNHFSTEAIYLMENKMRSRKVLENSTYIPEYKVMDAKEIDDEENLNFPLIMKAPNSTGSKDVYKIDDLEEFKREFKNLNEKYPDDQILIEEYLDGPQYLVEVLVVNKKVNIIAIVDQEISYINHHFIITGYYLEIYPPMQFYQELNRVVTEIVLLHGMENGACHLELRYVNHHWKLIEINPRISGGGMNQLIEASLGISLVKETLKLYLNEIPDLRAKFKRHVYTKYRTIENEGIIERVTGKNKAKKNPGVLKVYVKPRKGNKVSLPSSMGHRYAYVLATGNTKEIAMQNAQKAVDKITFFVREEE